MSAIIVNKVKIAAEILGNFFVFDDVDALECRELETMKALFTQFLQGRRRRWVLGNFFFVFFIHSLIHSFIHSAPSSHSFLIVIRGGSWVTLWLLFLLLLCNMHEKFPQQQLLYFFSGYRKIGNHVTWTYLLSLRIRKLTFYSFESFQRENLCHNISVFLFWMCVTHRRRSLNDGKRRRCEIKFKDYVATHKEQI